MSVLLPSIPLPLKCLWHYQVCLTPDLLIPNQSVSGITKFVSLPSFPLPLKCLWHYHVCLTLILSTPNQSVSDITKFVSLLTFPLPIKVSLTLPSFSHSWPSDSQSKCLWHYQVCLTPDLPTPNQSVSGITKFVSLLTFPLPINAPRELPSFSYSRSSHSHLKCVWHYQVCLIPDLPTPNQCTLSITKFFLL